MPDVPWLYSERADADDIDYRALAHYAAENHVTALDLYTDVIDTHGWAAAVDREGPVSPPPESTAYGTFCGCRRCVTREILWVTWPYAQLEAISWAADFVQRHGMSALADSMSAQAASFVGEEMLRAREADENLIDRLHQSLETGGED